MRPAHLSRRPAPDRLARLAEVCFWPVSQQHRYEARRRQLEESGHGREVAALKAFDEVEETRKGRAP